MAVGALDDSCCVQSSFRCALQYSLGDMVPLFSTGARIDRKPRGRKNILPSAFACRVRKLSREREREMDTAKPVFEILFVLRLNSLDVFPLTRWCLLTSIAPNELKEK